MWLSHFQSVHVPSSLPFMLFLWQHFPYYVFSKLVSQACFWSCRCGIEWNLLFRVSCLRCYPFSLHKISRFTRSGWYFKIVVHKSVSELALCISLQWLDRIKTLASDNTILLSLFLSRLWPSLFLSLLPFLCEGGLWARPQLACSAFGDSHASSFVSCRVVSTLVASIVLCLATGEWHLQIYHLGSPMPISVSCESGEKWRSVPK